MTLGKAEAFWVVQPSRGEIRETPLPGERSVEAEPAATKGRLRVRTLFSGISRGTETLVFRGEVPPSEYGRMRCPFQEGEFPAPVKYGYSNVGVVEDGPSDLLGRAVFCLYPHQTLYDVPADAVHPLPRDLPPERAILAANMETAVNGLWDAAPRAGDRIVVVGAGVVGCLVAGLAAQVPGTEVQLVDLVPERAAIARRLGVDFTVPDSIKGEADIIYHCSGNPAGLRSALRAAGFEATIVEMSWYGTREVALPLGEDFHVKRLQLLSSQVGSLAPARRSRRSYRDRLSLALELLRDPRFEGLIEREHDFAQLPEVMRSLSEPGSAALCRRIVYPS